MKKVSLSHRRLILESLEGRALLAGNVTIVANNGNVTITGDAEDNSFMIAMNPSGRFDILPMGENVFTGPTTDIEIRNLTVNLGDGHDLLFLYGDPNAGPSVPAQIPGRVKVDGGAGNDTIFMAVVADAEGGQTKSISVTGGDGDDNSLILFSAAKSISFDMGVGDDSAGVSHSTVRNLDIDTGVNQVGEGETDNDGVQLGYLTAQTINVRLGTSNQSPNPEGVSFNFANVYESSIGSLSIQGGDGVDSVNVHENVAEAVSIFTYGGDDIVEVARVETGLLLVSLGGGDDSLYADDVDATIATLLGGSGTDGRSLRDVDTLLLLELQFETVLPPLYP
jgi:hypothetical protein